MNWEAFFFNNSGVILHAIHAHTDVTNRFEMQSEASSDAEFWWRSFGENQVAVRKILRKVVNFLVGLMDADSNAIEACVKNVCAVARAVHEANFGAMHGVWVAANFCQVFS